MLQRIQNDYNDDTAKSVAKEHHGEIDEELNRLHKLIDTLCSKVGGAEDTFSAVCKPINTEKGITEAIKLSGSTRVSSELVSSNSLLNECILRLDNLITRSEL